MKIVFWHYSNDSFGGVMLDCHENYPQNRFRFYVSKIKFLLILDRNMSVRFIQNVLLLIKIVFKKSLHLKD